MTARAWGIWEHCVKKQRYSEECHLTGHLDGRELHPGWERVKVCELSRTLPQVS